ncbi:hypothetical protein ACFYRY_06690 [Streptomyces sp. NPDC005263]|uniref:hypothetical protein n=1 Tax=Streptomyces sp. NPDC005263 TaxID=3364711 RepID=UPI0036B022F5
MSPGPQRPVRLEVHTREPFAEAHRLPGTGAYEVLTATAHYAVDPRAAANHAIPDLDSYPPTAPARCASAVGTAV